MLHLLNGDAVLPAMRAAGLPGECAVWGDVLWEGPLLRDARADQQRQARDKYFAWPEHQPGKTLKMVEAWDRAIESAARHEEVVIWLEHDLHDQFQLLHHLDWFARQPHPCLTLICISEFPGVVPFHGLGQLGSDQLASLFPARQPVTSAQLELGQRAWNALREPSPAPLEQIWQGDTTALPYLAGAIQRFLEEYPETGTGLNRTERMILEALERGPSGPRELFRAVQRREERVFMGDFSFWRILHALAEGAKPLVRLTSDPEPRQVLPRGSAEITDAGRAVLAGQQDRVTLLGIDRWLGGVHLRGNAVPWHWDPATSRLQVRVE
jgi:hypothetical protein